MALRDQLTIVLSGPLAQRATASKLLASSGFIVSDVDHGHGLPDTTEGKKSKSTGWLTVHGEDVDKAVETVESLGWSLRGHWQSAAPLLDEIPQSVTEDRVKELIDQALQSRTV